MHIAIYSVIFSRKFVLSGHKRETDLAICHGNVSLYFCTWQCLKMKNNLKSQLIYANKFLRFYLAIKELTHFLFNYVKSCGTSETYLMTHVTEWLCLKPGKLCRDTHALALNMLTRTYDITDPRCHPHLWEAWNKRGGGIRKLVKISKLILLMVEQIAHYMIKDGQS